MVAFKVVKSLNNYKDGSEVELLEIMHKTLNTSHDSEELQKSIKDWPTSYHLNESRCNILLPINLNQKLKILDVGGGTGLLTRYLADKGMNITLLEGEETRARIAQERCKELNNVEIVVGEIGDLDKTIKYDLILIIGVLEYIGAKNSRKWLSQINELLEEDGSICLAIENRVGLKYFMGYPEDHTGNFWDGILNYYQTDKPKTYSKKELKNLLISVGLKNQNWWYPFPDYKMPTSILNSDIFSELDHEHVGTLITTPFQKAGHETLIQLNQKLLINSIAKAGLLEELSNSFLVFASRTLESKVKQEEALAVLSDPNYRRNKFNRKRYLRKSDNHIYFENKLKHMNSDLEKNNDIFHDTSLKTWVSGENLLQELIQKKINIILVLQFLFTKLVRLSSKSILIAKINPYMPSTICMEKIIENFDIKLDNFILKDEELFFIDQEWVSTKGICQQLALIRSLYGTFINNIELWKSLKRNQKETLWICISEIVKIICGNSHHSIEDFISAEKWFMQQISIIDTENLGLELKFALNSIVSDYSNVDRNLPLSHYGVMRAHAIPIEIKII